VSKADVQALLSQARRPERTVPLCLRGDLQAEVEDLERQLRQAELAVADKLSDGAEAHTLAERIEAIREEMKDSTVVFRLRALPRKAYSDLVSAHPADGDDEVDQAFGFGASTFFPALIQASAVEPELEPEQWDSLLDDTLTSRQFDELVDAVLALNRRPVDVPFSHAASRILQQSEPK
jgi:hypothetical protein